LSRLFKIVLRSIKNLLGQVKAVDKRRDEDLETELLQLMKNRRSIRKYSNESIPLEKIYQILEAGRYAPSGANVQPWIYIVVIDNELKEKIRREAEKIERRFHEKAPDQLKRWLKEQGITPKKVFLQKLLF